MKKALVRADMTRVFQVEPAGSEFPVAPPLEWRDCADDARPETHDFDGTNFVLKPLPPVGGRVSPARQRQTKIEELERRISLGAPQGEVNAAIIDLLRE